MKVFESKDLRNVGLIGHKACGKTSIAEAALWAAQVTKRLGSTALGTSVLDFEPEEHKRVMSTNTSVGALPWKKTKINLIDTPGDGNFLKDTRTSMQAMDGALCVVSAKDGVEPMTERVHDWAVSLGLARAFFISKMDVENADFDRAFAEIKENICREATRVQIPIGHDTSFRGVVDLLRQKAFLFKDGDMGGYEEADIPSDLKQAAEEARNTLIEDIASNDESLMEKFFEGDLTQAEVSEGLKKAMANGQIVPVFCGSGTQNRGVDLFLDFVVETFPSPLDRGPYQGTLDKKLVERSFSPEEPLACLVFKTIVDQHAGKISVMRVLSGEARSDTNLKNHSQKPPSQERLGTLNGLLGKKIEAVERAPAGDIFAVAKLKDAHTGNTLSQDGWVAQTIPLAAPLVSRAIRAKDKGAEDKIMSSLQRIVEEDPGLSLSRDAQTGETLLSGTGQQHIEVAVEKMKRKFHVVCEAVLPQIPYQETFTVPVKQVEGKHKKQSGGHGQFGVCYLDFEPTDRGTGFVFEDAIVGGSIPRQFIPSVEKGCLKAMGKGLLAGYPLVDIKVRVYDGKYHPVDSSDMAFQIAASKGFKAAAEKAHPVLLEPIMNMEIVVPEGNMGDVMGDVNTRRGRVHGSESSGRYVTIKAQMPLSEVQQYEGTLRSMTQGRGSFTMQHGHMESVPPNVQQKIVSESGFVAGDDDD